MLSCENDKEKMKQVMEQNENYLHLDRDAVTVIAAMTASKEIMNYVNQEQEGDVDMCQAIREMIEDGRQEGLQQGIVGCVNLLREVCCSDDTIINSLIKQYDLSQEEAKKYVVSL